jgi:hypothetical protein
MYLLKLVAWRSRTVPRMLLGFAVASVLAIAPSVPAQGAAAQHSSSPVWRFSDGATVGSSQLVRTGGGVSLTLGTQAPAGDAVTVWWVVFNHPTECGGAPGVPFRCAEPDLFNPDVEASVQFAAGHIVGSSGGYNVASYLSEGDTSGCAFGSDLCAGLIDADEADIHLVVRTHGPAIPAYLPHQFKSFDGACTPESSLGLGDGPNTCMDMQFAVHETE